MIFIAALVGLFFFWRRTKARLRQRRENEMMNAWPESVDLLMAALRAGYSPVQGIHFLSLHAPLVMRPAFLAVTEKIASGQRFTDALRELSQHIGPTARPLCEVLAAGDRLGIPMENLIFQLGNDARLSRRRAAEISARQLPIRLSLPLVICTLPSFIVLIIVPTIAGTVSQLRLSI